MTVQTTSVPGFRSGTWTVDPGHSEMPFTVRHLGVSKVRGTFDEFEATIVNAEVEVGGVATNPRSPGSPPPHRSVVRISGSPVAPAAPC